MSWFNANSVIMKVTFAERAFKTLPNIFYDLLKLM